MITFDLILEGLDRTGKSTQIANLWTHFNSQSSMGCNIIRGDKMQNSVIPTEDHKRLYMNSITHAFRNIHHNNLYSIPGIRIYDRLHLSEVVYGEKYRGYCTDWVYNIEEDYLRDVNKDNVCLILLVDEIENLIARDDGLGFTSDPAEITKEVNRFRAAFDDSTIENKHVININDKDIETVFAEILEIINAK